jgi:hypothetical protein
MLKIFQLLFVTLLVVSIFSISSSIIEKSSQTLTEKSLEQSDLEKETSDDFSYEYSLVTFTYSIKIYTSFSIYSTKNFKYQHNLLRPPIYS